MHDLLKTIKQSAVEAVEATQPTAALIGTVSSALPLSIRLNQRLIISAGHLLRLESVGSLGQGDTVALIRFSGGQKYLILGRLSI